MPAPVWRANSTYTGTTTTTSLAYPAGYAVDDILVCIFETGNNSGAGMSGLTTQTQTDLTNNGWTRVANSNTQLLSPTVAASQNTLQDIWWQRVTSTGQTAVTIGDTGDHTGFVMIALSGAVKTGNPWEGAVNITMTTASAQTNSGNILCSSGNCLVITVITTARDLAGAYVNASPVLFNGTGDDTELQERCDWGISQGHGGTMAVLTHRKPGTGLTANVRANLLNSNIAIVWTGALKGTKPYAFGEVSII